jgi:hypothetical protein
LSVGKELFVRQIEVPGERFICLTHIDTNIQIKNGHFVVYIGEKIESNLFFGNK